ncbi:glycosyltransferase family 10 [Hymenobacter sp. YC55]|uniref:glycosyltransferase family 10 domain-containing protein n=1 Tax=Hymenobacter sp. YC55 TaxID=3034019 RepID=UPI0023F9E12A|nr:glycosyltransferase family 10 [Hymenobacter sp. YC55]MDF7810195.1 glycosyltransferase family 10 [Hymenobacter sp. YC55]
MKHNGKSIKATLYVIEDPVLLQNGIFLNKSFYGMKNNAFMFASLRTDLAEHNIDLATQDIHPPEESDLLISLDNCLPFQKAVWRAGRKNYLVLSEPATYYPHNWNPQNHHVFDKIFTYNYNMVDNKRYFHYYFAIDLEENNQFRAATEEEFERRKLCVLMAASFGVVKPLHNSLSLLHERYLTLKWFAENHPNEFSLYSRMIHPKTYQSFRGLGLLQKIAPAALVEGITQVVASRRKALFDIVNKGPVPHDQKIPALRQYRFNIAYENTGGLPGYLTEKIFDSFAACCVPIYWGDPEVEKSIPKECFIDRRNFKSHEELYRFLKGMNYQEYKQYTEAIAEFISDVKQEKFGAEANARRISEVILKDIE